jgi:hypothetical protein
MDNVEKMLDLTGIGTHNSSRVQPIPTQLIPLLNDNDITSNTFCREESKVNMCEQSRNGGFSFSTAVIHKFLFRSHLIG